jgi:hypothetical protein
MAYATLNDLVARYGERELIQLTDLVNMPPSAIDADRVQIALDDASAVVDSYVGQVYALPLQGCAKPVTVPGADPSTWHRPNWCASPATWRASTSTTTWRPRARCQPSEGSPEGAGEPGPGQGRAELPLGWTARHATGEQRPDGR